MYRGVIFLALLCTNSALVSRKLDASDEDGDGEDVCFEHLGCFSTGYPWTSELRPLPKPADPRVYNAKMLFFTRRNKHRSIVIPIYPDIIFNGRFNPRKEKTIIIMPGTGSQRVTRTSWTLELKDVLLDRLDANVFILNTTGGQKAIDVFYAAANVPVMGAQVARFIDYLKGQGLTTKNTWIIAFGVGSHQAGIVGNKTHVSRITALDPQQQLYEGYPPEVRLDVSDADFVEVLHTDSRPLIPDGGVGFMTPIGDVDFYLNGGHQQPGCRFPRPYDLVGQPTLKDAIKEPVRLIVQSFLCAHKLAHRIFTAAIANQDCTFWGHPGTYENMLRAISNAGTEGLLSKYTALLSECDENTCVPFGLHTAETRLRGIFIITTTATAPYCIDTKDKANFELMNQQGKKFEQWFHSFFSGNRQNADNSWPQ